MAFIYFDALHRSAIFDNQQVEALILCDFVFGSIGKVFMLNIGLHKRKWFRCWNISYGVSNINPIYVKKQENEIQKLKSVQKRYRLCWL